MDELGVDFEEESHPHILQDSCPSEGYMCRHIKYGSKIIVIKQAQIVEVGSSLFDLLVNVSEGHAYGRRIR